MKLLCRDSAAYKFMMIGGLFSRTDFIKLPDLNIDIQSLRQRYLKELPSFSVKEKFLEKFLMDILKLELGWDVVRKKDDIWAFSSDGSDRLMIECKIHDPKIFYLEEHNGGVKGENAVQQVYRYFRENQDSQSFTWAVLTDGMNFRLYFNGDEPIFSEIFLEINLRDIFDSEDPCPYELKVLIDILSPNSKIRKIDPLKKYPLDEKSFSAIRAFLKRNPTGLRFLLKTLFVAAQEDMGMRPTYLDFKSIRDANDANDFSDIFASVDPLEIGFHTKNEKFSEKLISEIKILLNQKLTNIDFYHVDHAFFGEIYQCFINNGNASHYTNTSMSKELAKYIVGMSDKSQKQENPVYLTDAQYILDPALGSGQLLRGLLPYHKTMFAGRTSGISGWRELARRFIGRDIDSEAIWVAKLNIWLSTSAIGQPLLDGIDFQKLDIINATISRPAGESLKHAFKIDESKNIAGVVSNPPWDAFKSDKRRGITFDPEEVAKLRESLTLKGRQLNRAQIFSKIILKLSIESKSMKFAIILPDSFFIDQNYSLRDDFSGRIDFYFSFPSNLDHESQTKLFTSVDKTRKFGIIFGQGIGGFKAINCFPLGKKDFVTLSKVDRNIITFNEGAGDERRPVSAKVLPLYSDVLQQSIVTKWMKISDRTILWNEGEFHQSDWDDREGRIEATRGSYTVIGGTAFCSKEINEGVYPACKNMYWKKMSSVSENDKLLRNVDRLIFSDYINNSVKLNTASFLRAGDKLNITNKVLYSVEGKEKDRHIYNSFVFSTFIEIFATSQNINAYRLSSIPIPTVEFENHLQANYKLVELLGLTLRDSAKLYDLNRQWLSRETSKENWLSNIAQQIPALEELEALLAEIREASIAKTGKVNATK